MSFQSLNPNTPIDPFNTVSMTGVDAQTGMFFDADQTNSSILLKTADTPAMYIDKFQNMGINTTSPNAQLDVNSASNSHIQLTYNGSLSVKANVGVTSDGKLLLLPSGSEVAIDSTSSLNIKSHNGSNLGLMLNNALVLATADQLNYSTVTPGTASNGKALVLNSTGSVAGINSLSAVALSGTLQTAYQPKVTSVDTLDITSHNGIIGLALGGTVVTATGDELNYVDTTQGTAQASKALVLNSSRDISNIHNLLADNLTGVLQTSEQPNITSVGTLTGLNFDGPLTGLTELSINTDESGRTLVINHESGNTVRMYYDAATSAANYTDMLVDSSGSLNITASGGNVDITSHDGSSKGLKLGGVLLKADADELNFLYGSAPGSVTPGKAMVVDTNRNIVNVNSLVSTYLTGTIQTGAQPNISSVNTLNITNHDGEVAGLKLGNILVTATADELNFVDTTKGHAEASKAIILDESRTVDGIASLSASELVGELQTAAQPKITSLGTLTSLAVAGDVAVGMTTLSESEIKVLDSVEPGTVKHSSAVVVDSNKDISSFRNLTAINLTGTIQTAAQPNIASVTTLNITGHNGVDAGLALDGTLVSASATELNYVDTTPGAAQQSKALVLDGNRDIANIHSLSADQLTGTLQTSAQPTITSVGRLTSLSIAGDITVGGTTLSDAEVSVLDGVTPGIVSPSKALVVDSQKNISTLNSLSATTINAGSVVATSLTGTIQTGAQPNITSVTTLDITGHNGSTAGLKLGGTLLTATADQLNSIFGAGGEGTFNNLTVNNTLTLGGANGTNKGLVLGTTLVTADGGELNYLDGSIAGTVVASKALVVDANKDLSSLRNLTATNLTGTLQTAAQPNVTSVGTLTSLAVAGNVTVGSTTLSESEVGVIDAVTPGTVSASKALVVDSNKAVVGLSNVSSSTVTIPSSGSSYLGSLTRLAGTYTGTPYSRGLGVYSPTLDKVLILADAGGSYNTYVILSSTTGYSYGTFPVSGTMRSYGAIWSVALSKFIVYYWAGVPAYQALSSLDGINWVSQTISGLVNLSMATDIKYHSASGHYIFMNRTTFYYSSNGLDWNTTTMSGDINNMSFPVTNSLNILGNYVTTICSTQSSNYLTSIMYWTGTAWTEAGLNSSSLPEVKIYHPTEDRVYMMSSQSDSFTSLTLKIIDNFSTVPFSSWVSSMQTITFPITGGINYARFSYYSNYDIIITGISQTDSNAAYSARVYRIKNKTLQFSYEASSNGNTYYMTVGSHAWKLSNDTLIIPQIRTDATTLLLYSTPIPASGSLIMGTTTITESELAQIDGVTAGTASASKALVLDASKNVSGVNLLSSANLTSTAGLLTMGATAISESEIGVLDAVTPGTIAASKAVVVDANKDISSFRNLTSVNLASSAGSLTMGATNISEAEIGVLDSVTPGTAAASKALVLDSSKNVSGINSVSSASFTSTAGSLIMGATNISESEIGVLDAVTPGTISPSKAVVVDGNKDISSFRNLTAVTLSATSGSLTMGGTNINETEIAYLDSTIPGTAAAFKALVPDNNKDLTGLNILTTNELDATTLKIAGVTYNASSMNVLDGVTRGEAAADKAVILDATKSITGLGNVGASTLTATDGTLTLGATTINESEIGVLDSVTPGIVIASKAVVVDDNKDISSFRNLTAVNLTGTLQTAAQPNVTSVGTLISLGVTGDITTASNLVVGSTAISETDIAKIDVITNGTASADKALVVDTNRDITNIHNLTATNLTGTLQTAAQPNVTSVTTLDVTGHDGVEYGLALGGTLVTVTAPQINSLFAGTSDLTVVNEVVTTDINLSGHNGSTHGLKLDGTLVTADATEINYLADTTAGHAQPNKALIFNGDINIDGINNLEAANLTGTIQTASQPNITSVSTLNITGHDGSSAGLSLGGVLLTATATQINSIFGAGGEGTFTNLRVNDTLTLANADGTSKGLILGTTLVTASGTELNYLDGSTPGAASAGDALVLDSNRDIANINSLSAAKLTGEIQTAAQPNITSVGTLQSLDVAGTVTVGSTTLSESEIAVLNSVEPGTVKTSSAVVVDANNDISAFRNLTAANLISTTVTGTLQTAAQPNITSVGELTTLSVAGDVDVGGNLVVGGTFISEAEILALDQATPGTATANKAMITDSNNSIGGINSLSATSLTGTLSTPSQPNISSVGTLTSLDVAGDVDIGGNLNVGGTLISQSEIVALDAAVPGTATANKAMITDSNNSIGGINSLSATTLTGTIQTGEQPNITSVNTLDVTGHDGSTVGLKLNGTLITSTASELNYVDTTVGTAQATKALVLDDSKSIVGIHNVSLDELTAATGVFTNTSESSIVTAGGVDIDKSLTVGTTLTVDGSSTLTGVVAIGDESDATNAATGALTVSGGVGIAKSAYVGETLHVAGNVTAGGSLTQAGVVSITDETQSTATTNGALKVSGGAGIVKNLNVGGNTAIAGTLAVNGSTTLTGNVANQSTSESTSTVTGAIVTSGGVGIAKQLNVGGGTSLSGALSVSGATTAAGTVSITDQSSNALTVAGGTNIHGALSVNETAHVNANTASTSTATGALTVVGGTGISGALNVGGSASVAGNFNTDGTLTSTGAATIGGKVTFVDGTNQNLFAIAIESDYLQAKSGDGYKWNTNVDDSSSGTEAMQLDTRLSVNVPEEVTDTTDASSTTVAALTVAGGVGIAKKLFVGSDTSIVGAASIGGTLAQAGAITVADTSANSISTAGGVGIARALHVGTTASIDGNTTIGGTLVQTGNVSIESTDESSLGTAGGVDIAKSLSVGSTATIVSDVSIGGNLAQAGTVAIASTVDATNTVTGSFKTAGGAGIGKSLHVGGDIVVAGTISASGPMNQNGALTISDSTDSISTTTGAIVTAGGVGIAKSVHVGGSLTIESGAASVDKSSGAFVVKGGIGVTSDINVGGDLHVEGDEYLVGDFNIYGKLNTGMVNWIPDASSPFDTDPITVITNYDTVLSINRNAGIGYLYSSNQFVLVPNLVTNHSVLYVGSIADDSASWISVGLAGDALTTVNNDYSDEVLTVNQVVVRPWSNKIWIAGSLCNANSDTSVGVVLQGTVSDGMNSLYFVGNDSTTSADTTVTRIAVTTDDANIAAIRYISSSQADIYYANISDNNSSSSAFALAESGNFLSINWLNGLGKFCASRSASSAIYTSTNISAEVWVDGTTPSGNAPHTMKFNTTLNLAIAVGDNFIWYSTNGYVWSNCTYDALASGKSFGAVVNSPSSGMVAVYSEDQVYYSTNITTWNKIPMAATLGRNVCYDPARYVYALTLNGAVTAIQKMGPVTEASRVYTTSVSGGYIHSDSASGYKWYVDSTSSNEGTPLLQLNNTSLSVTPAVRVSSTTESSNTATGSIITAGGVGIAKSLTVGMNAAVTGTFNVAGASTQSGIVSVTNVTDSSSSTSGALKITGGVGIGKSLHVGADAVVEGALSIIGNISSAGKIMLSNTTESNSATFGSLTTAGGVGIAKSINVGVNATVLGALSIGGMSTFADTTALTGVSDASSTTTGVLTVAGGVGIAKKLFVGSDTSLSGSLSVAGASSLSKTAVTDSTDATSLSEAALIVVGGVSIAKKIIVGSDALVTGNLGVNGAAALTSLVLSNTSDASSTTTGALTIAGGVGIAKKLFVGSNVFVSGELSVADLVTFSNGTDAVSTTTGSLKVSGGAGVAKKLYVGGGIYGTVMTGSQPFITSVSTLDISSHDGLQGLKLGGVLVTCSADELNYVDGSTPGNAVAGKALIVDLSRNIANINALTAGAITGTLQTASQPNITNVNTLDVASHDGTTRGLSLGGVLLTATASQINSLFNGNSDLNTVNATVTHNLTLSGQNGTDTGLILGATLVTSSGDQLNYVNTTPGTAEASKALVFDSNKSISGIDALSAVSLTGTLQTAAQPNITSVTTLDISGHNGSTSGLSLEGRLVTATAAELNYVDVTSPGTAQASKAVVLDSNQSISGINSLTASELSGVLQTSSQPQVTSLGTLTSLAIANAGALTIGSTVVNESDIAKIAGVTNGTAQAGKALVLDNSKNILDINAVSAASLAVGAPTNSLLPLEIGSQLYTVTQEYAYHNGTNSLGLVQAGESTQLLYSARFESRILAQEIQLTSDSRMKRDVEDLDLDMARRFVKQARAVSFNWIDGYGDKERTIGFIAQELARQDIPGLVTLAPEPGLREMVSEDGFISPKDAKLTVSHDKIIPLLTTVTKDLCQRDEERKTEIADLEMRLMKLIAELQDQLLSTKLSI